MLLHEYKKINILPDMKSISSLIIFPSSSILSIPSIKSSLQVMSEFTQ